MMSIRLVQLPNGKYRMEPFEEPITARMENVRDMTDVIDLAPISHSPSRSMRYLNRYTIGIAVMALVVIGWNIMPRALSAEAIAKQAYELRMQARRSHCQTMVERMSACYAQGDSTACKQAGESAAWFLKEYGETHEFACSTADRPFGAGVSLR